MKFTIDQLKYASEVCFRDDFSRLLRKHLPDEWKDCTGVWAFDYKNKYHCNLLEWVFSWSRADLERNGMGTTIDNMLAELIGDYGQ